MKKALLAIILGLIVIFPGIFFFSKTFFYGDNITLVVPGKIFLSQSIKEGKIPFWNPYILSGIPFYADINQALLYPFTYLFVMAPPAVAVNIVILFHLAFSALGMYAVTFFFYKHRWKALIAAFMWMLSSTVIFSAGNITILNAASWIPWMFLCTLYIVEKRSKLAFLCFPLCIFLSFAAGHPQPTLFGLLLSFGYVLWMFLKKRELKSFGLLLLGFLLSLGMLSVLVFPFIELSSRSTRVNMTTQDVLGGSLNPSLLVQWIVPNVFSNPDYGMSWGSEWDKFRFSDGYMTLLGLVSLCAYGVFAKKRWDEKYFYIVLVGSLIFSMAKFMPVIPFLYDHLSFLRLLRNPGAFLFLWVFTTSILAGNSIEFIASFLRNKKMYVFPFVATLILLVLYLSRETWFVPAWNGVDVFLHGKLSLSVFHTLERDRIISTAVIKSALFVFLFFTVNIWLLSRKKILWQFVTVLIFFDMYLAVKPYFFVAPATIYDQNSVQADVLKKHIKTGERYISSNDYLPWSDIFTYFHDMVVSEPFADTRFTNEEKRTYKELTNRKDGLSSGWGMVYGLPTPYGYSTFILKNNSEYWKSDLKTTDINTSGKVEINDKRLAEQGVSFMTLDLLIYPKEYVNTYLKGHTLIESNDRMAVFSLDNSKLFIQPIDPKVIVSKIEIKPNALSFDVDNGGDIFIAQSYYPGWTCRSLYGECVIKEVYGGIVVTVPKGVQHVVLTYLPTNIRTYAYISIAFFALLGLLGLKFFAPNRGIKRVHKK